MEGDDLNKYNVTNFGEKYDILQQQCKFEDIPDKIKKNVSEIFNNRTLPHFSQYDNTTESRGFIENNFYNHIRDLTALSISMIQLNSKTSPANIKILDYGSNITPWANVQRKIDIDSIDVTIFDPYYDSQSINVDLGFSLFIFLN